MSCSEGRRVAFLARDLDEEDSLSFDRHLLECEQCWRAVQEDRSARLALERLREPAPPGLGERVAAGIALRAGGGNRSEPGRASGSRRARVFSAALMVVGLLGGLLGWQLSQSGTPADPPQLTAVMTMLHHGDGADARLRAGENLAIGGQQVVIRSFSLGGTMTIVAMSMRPFTMPPSSHLLAGSSPHAWMATRGAMAVYGVNRPAGFPSMFLVASMPMAELPLLAARLHLI